MIVQAVRRLITKDIGTMPQGGQQTAPKVSTKGAKPSTRERTFEEFRSEERRTLELLEFAVEVEER
jgi:hypothetical protein